MGFRNVVHSLAAAAAVSWIAPAAQAFIIDDFSAPQTLSATALTPETWSQVVGTMLGGERDAYLLLTAGTSASAEVVGGTSTHRETPPGSDSEYFLVWDGPDNLPTIDRTGLGGIDFTVGGTQNALALTVILSQPVDATNLSFLAYSSAVDVSQAFFTAPATAGAITVNVPYADFIPITGAGADFTNIGALAFFSDDGIPGQSLDFSILQTTSVPEPSSLALVLLGLTALAAGRRRTA